MLTDTAATQTHFPPPPPLPPPQQAPPVQYAPPAASPGYSPTPPTQQYSPPPSAALNAMSLNSPPTQVGAYRQSQESPAPGETFNMNQANNTPGGAASAQHFASESHVDDVGSFNGGAYRISHRDTNSVLTVQLAIGCPLHVKPGM